jgi:hypothetical protein
VGEAENLVNEQVIAAGPGAGETKHCTGSSGIPCSIEPVVNDVKALLSSVFGERLKGLVLYGSFARGDADNDSDIDILAILDHGTNPFEEREKYFKSLWAIAHSVQNS